MVAESFLSGEYKRSLDERFRLTLPTEFAEGIVDVDGDTLLTKEQYGCLSLWPARQWTAREDASLAVMRQKILAGRLDNRWSELQRLGRLISTRSRSVKLANRARLLIPEGFREFLDVPAGGELMVVGAGICVEVWKPEAWVEKLREEIPRFENLLRDLTD